MRKTINKHGVFKGGHVFIVSGVDFIWPRAYVTQQNLWERLTGFKMEGPNEVRMILEKLDNMVIGVGHVETGKTRKIFKNKSGLCWYN